MFKIFTILLFKNRRWISSLISPFRKLKKGWLFITPFNRKYRFVMFCYKHSFFLKISALLLLLFVLMNCSRFGDGSGREACSLSFDYSIDTIDGRFNVTEQEVEAAVMHALELWAPAIDSLHVSRSKAGRNSIRFVYDERQEFWDRSVELKDNIVSGMDRINRLKQERDRAEQQYTLKQGEHQQQVNAMNTSVDGLNEWIDEKNQSGGFGAQDIAALDRQKAVLEHSVETEQRLREELEQLEQVFQQLHDRVNRAITFSNQLTDHFNNEFGGSIDFDGGTYQGTGRRGVITVYQFDSNPELKVLLAHEIGHAMGLGHVENSRSIMNKRMGGQYTGGEMQLSPQDVKEIRKVAGCLQG